MTSSNETVYRQNRLCQRVTVGNSLNVTGNGGHRSTFIGNSTLLPCTDIDQRPLLPVRFNEFPVSI